MLKSIINVRKYSLQLVFTSISFCNSYHYIFKFFLRETLTCSPYYLGSAVSRSPNTTCPALMTSLSLSSYLLELLCMVRHIVTGEGNLFDGTSTTEVDHLHQLLAAAA